MNEEIEAAMKLARELLSMPRRDRAREQGIDWLFTINGQTVTRLTRRYWRVAGNPVKLNKAVEMLS